MRRSLPVLFLCLTMLALAVRQAAASSNVPPAGDETFSPNVARTQASQDDGTEGVSRAGRIGRAAAVGETVWVFVDSLETRTSPNNEGGWTHYDASEKPTAWHIDPLLSCQGNSWWCGIVDSSWIYDTNRAGYDNDWVQYLSNSIPIATLSAGTAVSLGFKHHFDAEPGYDFGTVEVLDPLYSWIFLASFTGKVPNGAGCDSFSTTIPDSVVSKWYAGSPEDSIFTPIPIPFRLTFTSDVGWSSADGLYDGDGWIIDNITARGGTSVIFFDDCESGMGNWDRTVHPGVGDYFFIQKNLVTEDLCSPNQTNVWTDWNAVFQSLVPGLDNFVVTPPISTDRASTVFVAFDVYRNLPLNSCFYYHLNFRTKNIGDPEWGNWIDPTLFVYYGGSKDWARQRITLAGASNKDSVQVQLGLRDYSVTYCDGVSSPANTYSFFDNVALGVIGQAPPSFIVRDIDLFNDTFQTTPFFADDNFNSAIGDSTVVQINASRGYKEGYLNYRLNGGSFTSTPLQNVAPALPNHFYGDVAAGSYPPNTTIEYYFSATDSLDNTAYHPATAITNQKYLSASILPVKTAINIPLGCIDSLASILFVNHFSGRESQPYIANTLTSLGYKFDTWEVNGPSSGVGNSLGGSDPADLQYHWPVTDVNSLLQYSTIIWHSGDLTAFTITKQDQAVIQSWVQQPGKNRNFWITGDDIAYELTVQGQEYNSFLGFTCGARYLRNIWENTPQDSLHPIVVGVAGTPSANRLMHLNGDCPILNMFDLVTLSSTATQSTGKSGLFLKYPNTFGAATRYATKYNTFATDSARVVFQGFSFNYIEEGGERVQLAQAVVKNYFKENACYVATAVEEDPASQAPTIRNALGQNAPNPFNPETAIHYSVAQTGAVEIRIYNVNGAKVRTLVSRVHGPGVYTARWNGTDDHGRPLSSGAYFYRLESQNFQESKKLILLR